jgi:hypothetical protein
MKAPMRGTFKGSWKIGASGNACCFSLRESSAKGFLGQHGEIKKVNACRFLKNAVGRRLNERL